MVGRRYAGFMLAAVVLLAGCSDSPSPSGASSGFTPGTSASASSDGSSASTTPDLAVTSSAASPTPATSNSQPLMTSKPAPSPSESASAVPSPSASAKPSVSALQITVAAGRVSMVGRPTILDYTPVVTADPEKNAVLTDLGDFVRTVLRIYDGDPDKALISRYAVARQRQVLDESVEEERKIGGTSRGTVRLWNAKVTEIRKTTVGRVATVTTCGNQSKWIAINKAGKTLPGNPAYQANFSQTFSLVNTGDNVWRVSLTDQAKFRDPACR